MTVTLVWLYVAPVVQSAPSLMSKTFAPTLTLSVEIPNAGEAGSFPSQ